jgi:uncharacterized iron-regulated membrane protein
MATRSVNSKMRIYHRYLGFFLAGIMAVYAISGIVLIFRDTNFLKRKKTITSQLAPNLSIEEVGKSIRIRDLKAKSENGDTVFFAQGTYNKTTGDTKYSVTSLPVVIEKLTRLHKANSKSPLFYLNIFFGLSLLFFVISAFWMFMPRTTIYKRGLYFTLAGIILTLIMLFV